MEISTVITIFSVLLATITTYIAVMKYKNPKLVFKVSEISDFNLNKEFYNEIQKMPILIEIKNLGNKSATNLKLILNTETNIIDYPESNTHQYETLEKKTNSIVIGAKELNPSEKISLQFNCLKRIDEPTKKVVKDISLTSSEVSGLSHDDYLKSIDIPAFPLFSSPPSSPPGARL